MANKLWGWRWNGTGIVPDVPARDVALEEARALDMVKVLDASPAHKRELVPAAEAPADKQQE